MMIDLITTDPNYQRLVLSYRSAPRGACAAEGLWGSSAPIVAGLLARELQQSLLYVTAHLDQADESRDDLEMIGLPVELLPAYDSLPGEGSSSSEVTGERLRLCQLLHSVTNSPPDSTSVQLMVAPIQALMQPVPSLATLQALSLDLAVGQDYPLEQLMHWLVEHGFSRLEWVEAPGDFAVRGGIVDIFSVDHAAPLRIELFDERVESLRRFDLSSQRSIEVLKTARVTGVAGVPQWRSGQIDSVINYLPEGALICWHEPAEIQELGQTFWRRLDNPRGMFPVENVLLQGENRRQLWQARFGGVALPEENHVRFEVASVQRLEADAVQVVTEVLKLLDQKSITVYCDNTAEAQRFTEVVQDAAPRLPERLQVVVGTLHHGFEWVSAQHIFVGHHELFHRYQQRRKIRKSYAGRPLDSWLDLQVGDFVVHTLHGIARFKGLAPMRKGQSEKYEEYLTLEFSGGATILVPASQIDLVQKYIGVGNVQPALSVLGGSRWKKTKEKVAEAINEFAGELLRLQAMRAALPGTAYPPDTAWQREFEAEFPYTETEDQLKVLEEIKSDLSRRRPMDRLLCGDVGYGKTELAIRAAFKVVEYGRQVAVLVPTTILAEQHYQTFRERLADYPFSIACLSRFRSGREQEQIIAAARLGRVDIIIGTHRLLSSDVGFADLGLLVIDEEQRFGVEHKERLKRFRESIDVLTLTATPIPRTLHMSMVGIRDISALATPPLDRRSIVTQVRPFEADLIRAAVVRELNRDGQVFFVHNRVQTIERMVERLRQIVPEARIIFGHGQMAPEELEEVMLKFVRREADILLCTTIIESGIDIPTANTIFIDQADRFGLADLHQLRGRVGRYRHRAYCYLLLPADRTLTPNASKRLKAIEEYSELGAGFRIALRDLEIRGAGNILGPQQSGHIAAVGYDLYCQLLERTIKQMKGEAEQVQKPVHLELDVAAHIPKAYIRTESARMEIYRRLASCRRLEELTALAGDMTDAFGPYPPVVQTLLDLAELRILAGQWTIRSIIRKLPDIVFEIEELARVEPAFHARRHLPGTVRMPDPHTIHWRLPPAYLETATLLAVLRKLLSTS
ncbi:MAG: Transcription-repair-coupling factor [Phycisphaerae bacterium]|nr:Transcription-repair-coupling factor [Phycisphaerae bacterium]